MADITCAKCGESWDRYGVEHGDMHPGEARMLLEGRGCPACEGDPETPPSTETHHNALQSAAVAWDGCPITAIETIEANHSKPYDSGVYADLPICTCEACGVSLLLEPSDFTYSQWKRLLRSADLAATIADMGIDGGITDYEVVKHSTASKQRYTYSYFTHDSTDFDVHESSTYCPDCLTECNRCGEKLLTEDATVHGDDAYHYDTYHYECLHEELSEEHNEHVSEAIGDTMNGADLIVLGDNGLTTGGIQGDLSWDRGGSDPTSEAIVGWILEHNLAIVAHYEYGGPYTLDQWRIILATEDETDLHTIYRSKGGCFFVTGAGMQGNIYLADSVVFAGTEAECYAECARLNAMIIGE